MQIVSLTTDFGTRDYHVAELKASILIVNPNTQIVDVSHEVDSYDIVEAAYNIGNVYQKFPLGTIHVVSVYNYYDTKSEFVVLYREGHYFVAPNNGVLTLVFYDLQPSEVYVIDREKLKKDHLLNIFAHVVGYLSHGLPIEELGEHPRSVNQRIGIQPVVTSNQIRATIIHIDHFGNVVVNLKRKKFEQIRNNRNYHIYYQQNDPIMHISKDYGDVGIGEVLCLFNSADYMEIAINVGRANELLSLKKNETIQINFYD